MQLVSFYTETTKKKNCLENIGKLLQSSNAGDSSINVSYLLTETLLHEQFLYLELVTEND